MTGALLSNFRWTVLLPRPAIKNFKTYFLTWKKICFTIKNTWIKLYLLLYFWKGAWLRILILLPTLDMFSQNHNQMLSNFYLIFTGPSNRLIFGKGAPSKSSQGIWLPYREKEIPIRFICKVLNPSVRFSKWYCFYLSPVSVVKSSINKYP